MGDFDTPDLLADWDGVLTRAGAITAAFGSVTFSGVWAEQVSGLEFMEEQLRNEKRFAVFTTYTQLPTPPAPRQTITRSSVTYVVESVNTDAEACGIQLNVKRVI